MGEIKNVAIVGAGTMGNGIAQVFGQGRRKKDEKYAHAVDFGHSVFTSFYAKFGL